MGNVAYRRIVELFQVSMAGLSRHKQHIGELLGEARGWDSTAEDLSKATDVVLGEVRAFQRRLKVARDRNTPETCDMLLKLSREIRALLELRSKLSAPGMSGSSPVPRTTPSRESLDDEEAELTTEEADQLAAKWLARRSENQSEASTAATTDAEESDPTP
jgi:hypothetical protein